MVPPNDEPYAQQTLRLEEYFAGTTRFWGVFRDRFGTVRRQFTIAAHGDWDGKTLTLKESIAYDDGASEQRTWRIEKIGPTDYEGRADDVVGTALGTVDGNALRLRYKFTLAFANRSLTLQFDDCMYLQDEGLMLNSVTVSKFGIRIGEITGVFVKRTPRDSSPVQSAHNAGTLSEP